MRKGMRLRLLLMRKVNPLMCLALGLVVATVAGIVVTVRTMPAFLAGRNPILTSAAGARMLLAAGVVANSRFFLVSAAFRGLAC